MFYYKVNEFINYFFDVQFFNFDMKMNSKVSHFL